MSKTGGGPFCNTVHMYKHGTVTLHGNPLSSHAAGYSHRLTLREVLLQHVLFHLLASTASQAKQKRINDIH